jgi:hypothetical protein
LSERRRFSAAGPDSIESSADVARETAATGSFESGALVEKTRSCRCSPRFVLKIEVANKNRAFWVSMFAIPSYHPALATIVHVLRERQRESHLEKQLEEEAAIREPLWPMTTGGGESSRNGRTRSFTACRKA